MAEGRIRSHNQGDNGQLLWNLIKTIKIYLFQSIKIGLKFWQGRSIFDKWLSGWMTWGNLLYIPLENNVSLLLLCNVGNFPIKTAILEKTCCFQILKLVLPNWHRHLDHKSIPTVQINCMLSFTFRNLSFLFNQNLRSFS